MPIIATSHPMQVADVYDALITPNFPSTETPDRADFVSAVGDGRLRVLVSREDQGLLGVAVMEPLTERTTLLAWLAVGREARGRGIGGQLLTHVLGLEDVARERLLFAEIELPGHAPRDDRHGDPARRAQFYAQHGARAVCLPHSQPPFRPSEPAVPLQLIAFPQASAVELDGSVIAEFERAYLDGLQEGPIWGQVMSALARIGEDGGAGGAVTADLLSLYAENGLGSTR